MNQRASFLMRFLLIAAGYCATYAVTRGISLVAKSGFNWRPEAGLRFSVLLLLPMRYWPALVFGEAVALFGANYYMCWDEQGPIWVIVNSLPRALEVMPFVWLLRRWVPDIRDGFVQWIPRLLMCSAAAAAGPTLFGWLSYNLMRQLPPGEAILSFGSYFGQMFMGHYLAILSFTPLVLWGAQYVRHAISQP